MQDREILHHRKQLAYCVVTQDIKGAESYLQSLGNDVHEILNSPSKSSNLPLYSAVELKSPAAVQLLIRYGADVNAVSRFNRKVLDLVHDLLDTAFDLESFNLYMQCAIYMLQDNIAKGRLTAHMNNFVVYLLRIQKVGLALGRFDNPFYPEWVKVIKQLAAPLKDITTYGGDIIADLREELTRSGHMLGIEMSANFHINDFALSTESIGNDTLFSKYYLHEILSEYIAEGGADAITRKRLQNILLGFEQTNPNIKIISTGWRQHDVYVAQIGGYLVLCNRGQSYSAKTNGVKIFKLFDPHVDVKKASALARDAKEFADRIDDMTPAKQAEVFEERLAAIVDLNHPVKIFAQFKGQKHGTCSFVNAKGLIAPLLFLTGDEEAYKTYKDFTAWMRDREVQHLLGKFTQARLLKNLVARDFYFQVLCKYAIKLKIMDAREFTSKRGHDRARFSEIMDEFMTFATGRNFIRRLDSEQDLAAMYAEPLVVRGMALTETAATISISGYAAVKLDYGEFKCSDEVLRSMIFGNFKERYMDVAVELELAKHVTDPTEQAAAKDKVGLSVDLLMADWQMFLHAIGKAQVLQVAQSYVQERKKSWVVSSIFSVSHEKDALAGLEQYVAQKLR